LNSQLEKAAGLVTIGQMRKLRHLATLPRRWRVRDSRWQNLTSAQAFQNSNPIEINILNFNLHFKQGHTVL
jgi:hypothetical protein